VHIALIAAQYGRAGTLAMLLQAGAAVNATIHDGATPLLTAAMLGNEAAVSALLGAEAETIGAMLDGRTPLLMARTSYVIEHLVSLLKSIHESTLSCQLLHIETAR